MSIQAKHYSATPFCLPPTPTKSYMAMSDSDEWKKLESRIDRLEKKLDNFIRELLKQKNAK